MLDFVCSRGIYLLPVKNCSIAAMKQYDGVPLDGKPMKIEVAAPQNVVAAGNGVNKQKRFRY